MLLYAHFSTCFVRQSNFPKCSMTYRTRLGSALLCRVFCDVLIITTVVMVDKVIITIEIPQYSPVN